MTAFVRSRSGIADNVLRKAGFSTEGVEAYLSSLRNSGAGSAIQEDIALGRSAITAFERAQVEAHARKHTYLGVEHFAHFAASSS